MLNVWLNDMAVGLTKLCKTQRMINLLCAAFEVMSYNQLLYQLLHIYKIYKIYTLKH